MDVKTPVIGYGRVKGAQMLAQRKEYEALFAQLTTDIQPGWFAKACEYDQNMIRIVAHEGERIVGFALGHIVHHFTGKDLFVNDVVVDESVRGCGVGRRLMETLEGVAKAHQCKHVQLTASREGAQRFYEELGYCGSRTTAFRKIL